MKPPNPPTPPTGAFNFEAREAWRDIDILLSLYSRRADNFREELRQEKRNIMLEKQNSLSAHDEDFDAIDTLPAPGTKQAKIIAKELKEEALKWAVEYGDTYQEELDLYRLACKLCPSDQEAIKAAAHCFRFLGEYDRCIKKLVHLAVIAKDNNDLALANFVLNGRLIDEELLLAQPPHAANTNEGPKP